MDRAGFEDWLRRYFDAWVSNDPVTARTGGGGGQGGKTGWDGILTIAFAPDGRCREHREWFSHREIS